MWYTLNSLELQMNQNICGRRKKGWNERHCTNIKQTVNSPDVWHDTKHKITLFCLYTLKRLLSWWKEYKPFVQRMCNQDRLRRDGSHGSSHIECNLPLWWDYFRTMIGWKPNLEWIKPEVLGRITHGFWTKQHIQCFVKVI